MSPGPRPGQGGGPAHAIVKPCGTCSLCCKVMTVNSLGKASGSWCRHFAKGVGCTMHADKPGECRNFQCYWSISVALGEEWRPDRARFLIWSDAEGRIIVEVDPSSPGAWRKEPYYSEFKRWTNPRRPLPLQVWVRAAGRMTVVFPEADIDLGPFRQGVRIEQGYRDEGGRQVPWARWADEPA